MSLPFPRRSPNKHLLTEKFHKSQHFNFSNGVPIERSGVSGEQSNGQKVKHKPPLYPRGSGPAVPSWVAFDKQVLCFDAHFQETVPQAQNETYRIRKCKIYYYLENDTIQVVEPEYKNSGIPQGTLIHRQRIPLPPPNNDQYYSIYHFNINQQMVLFSRTFTLTNCDVFTKRFLTKVGVILNDPVTEPIDPYSNHRDEIDKSMRPLRPYERRDTLKQFMDHDCQVLRFFCIWNDTVSAFGDLRELVLHYYLSDDSIEVYEIIPPNSGRDAVTKFLRRSKLPKQCSVQIKQPGAATDRTVLNVLASTNMGRRYILDSLKTGTIHQEFYRDSDLMIGAEVNVWGRNVILCDCDEFTKEYYRNKYAIEDFSPLQYKTAPAQRPTRLLPPYNGFGSEEDSLSSCQGLLPKPPRKDFRKFMEKDRCGLDQNVLKFRAKMVTTNEIDRERVFIISFYLSDDSISIFEFQQKNSGVHGGKFLERGRVKKPGQELYKTELSKYFAPQDLYVGATLYVNTRPFQIMDADEYTFNYMEKHAEEFPKANVGTILSKIRSVPEEKKSEIKKFLALSDPTNTGFIPFESLRSLLMGLDCGLSEHEVLVLGRSFSEEKQPEVDMGLMMAVAQDFLKKKPFDEITNIARAFAHHDRNKTGRVSFKEMRTICKAFQLPLSDSFLRGLLSKFADGDEIDYHAFLAGINWLEHPAPSVRPDDVLKFDVNLRSDTSGAAARNVNYSFLLQDIIGDAPNNSDPTTNTASA